MIQLSNYTIFFEDKKFKGLRTFLKNSDYSHIYILVDENTERDCWPVLQPVLEKYNPVLIAIPAGEPYKNILTVQEIWRCFLETDADRKSLLINLGGGVIGDMGGFCASTFKRGMDFIQIPTTLLAQVDASVGGKLGIDFEGLKNGIGLFGDPKAVFVAPLFFKTLPFEELRSGFAEILKHALIQDASYWKKLQSISKIKKVKNWNQWIETSLYIKKNIVEQDPFEQNIRKALNFGHTIGHAVESLSWDSPKPLLHGEAVAIGMICESWISYKMQLLSKKTLKEIVTTITSVYPVADLSFVKKGAFWKLIKNDKKNEKKATRFTLLKAIGKAVINQEIGKRLSWESLAYYQSL